MLGQKNCRSSMPLARALREDRLGEGFSEYSFLCAQRLLPVILTLRHPQSIIPRSFCSPTRLQIVAFIEILRPRVCGSRNRPDNDSRSPEPFDVSVTHSRVIREVNGTFRQRDFVCGHRLFGGRE